MVVPCLDNCSFLLMRKVRLLGMVEGSLPLGKDFLTGTLMSKIASSTCSVSGGKPLELGERSPQFRGALICRFFRTRLEDVLLSLGRNHPRVNLRRGNG